MQPLRPLMGCCRSAPRCEAVQTPQMARVLYPIFPLVGHCSLCAPLRNAREPLGGRGHVAICSTCGRLWITPSPPLRSIRDRLCNPSYLANLPICGPFPILFHAVKHSKRLRWHGLCSQCAHLWAAFDFAPTSQASDPPKCTGCGAIPPICVLPLIFLFFQAPGTPSMVWLM